MFRIERSGYHFRNDCWQGYNQTCPDSTRIIFSSNADGNYQLYVINVDATNRLRLTFNTFSDLQPDW